MMNINRRGLRLSVLLMLAPTLLILPGFAARGAAEAPPPRTQPTLREDLMSVTGTSDVQAAPDTANVSFGVVSQAKTAAAASSEEARKMTAVIDAVRATGVKDEDIHTDQLSLQPQTRGQNPRGEDPNAITGFQATNNVQVTVHDIAAHPGAVGPIVDAALGAGVNQINGVNFFISNDTAYRAQALGKAAATAAAKAQVLAQVLNLNLAGVASVSEGISTAPQPMFSRMMVAAAAPETPVLPGQIAISASVTLQYHITAK